MRSRSLGLIVLAAASCNGASNGAAGADASDADASDAGPAACLSGSLRTLATFSGQEADGATIRVAAMTTDLVLVSFLKVHVENHIPPVIYGSSELVSRTDGTKVWSASFAIQGASIHGGTLYWLSGGDTTTTPPTAPQLHFRKGTGVTGAFPLPNADWLGISATDEGVYVLGSSPDTVILVDANGQTRTIANGLGPDPFTAFLFDGSTLFYGAGNPKNTTFHKRTLTDGTDVVLRTGIGGLTCGATSCAAWDGATYALDPNTGVDLFGTVVRFDKSDGTARVTLPLDQQSTLLSISNGTLYYWQYKPVTELPVRGKWLLFHARDPSCALATSVRGESSLMGTAGDDHGYVFFDTPGGVPTLFEYVE